MVNHVVQGRVQGFFLGGGGVCSITGGEIGFGWSKGAGMAFSGVGSSVGCGSIMGCGFLAGYFYECFGVLVLRSGGWGLGVGLSYGAEALSGLTAILQYVYK